MIDQFALAILEWIGRIIAQRIAGSALNAAWKRLSTRIKSLLKSSSESEDIARERAGEADEMIRESIESAALLREAAARIKILEAENAALRAQLSNHAHQGQPSSANDQPAKPAGA